MQKLSSEGSHHQEPPTPRRPCHCQCHPRRVAATQQCNKTIQAEEEPANKLNKLKQSAYSVTSTISTKHELNDELWKTVPRCLCEVDQR